MVEHRGVIVGTGIIGDKEYSLQEYLTTFLITFGNAGTIGADDVNSTDFFADGRFYNWHSMGQVGLMYVDGDGCHKLTQEALDLIKENKHD